MKIKSVIGPPVREKIGEHFDPIKTEVFENRELLPWSEAAEMFHSSKLMLCFRINFAIKENGFK